MIGAIVLAPAAPARATLMLSLYQNAILIGTFTDNMAGDSDPTIGSLNVAGAVNTLGTTGFHFTALGATSTNVPVNPTDANLTQTINATANNSATGGGTLDLIVTDTSFPLPTNPQTMVSSASTTFTQGLGVGPRLFQSWFNPSNLPFAMDIPATLIVQPTLGTGSLSDTNFTPIPPFFPFGLTNETIVSLVRSTSTINRNIQTLGTTIIVGRAVPEPATIAMVIAGLPLVGFSLWRSRRKAS